MIRKKSCSKVALQTFKGWRASLLKAPMNVGRSQYEMAYCNDTGMLAKCFPPALLSSWKVSCFYVPFRFVIFLSMQILMRECADEI